MSLTIGEFYDKLKSFSESFEIVADERDETWIEFDDEVQLTASEEKSTVASLIEHLDKYLVSGVNNHPLMTSGGYEIINVVCINDKIYVQAKEE